MAKVKKEARLGKGELVAVILSLAALGFGWMREHQATAITLAVIVFVWIINWLAQKKGIHLGKRWLTAILFGLATGLTLIFTPVTLPAFPPYAGDPGIYTQELVEYVMALITIGQGVALGATALYNLLLEKVLEKIPDAVSGLLGKG